MSLHKIKNIVVHTSASAFGCALLINEWHIERKFSGIGYHYVIGNGFTFGRSKYNPFYNGALEPGRREWLVGAHVGNVNRNHDTLGVCLIGDPERSAGAFFTAEQLQTLRGFLKFLLHKHKLNVDDVVGHCELDSAKPNCPGVDMDDVRRYLNAVTEKETNLFLSRIDGVEQFILPHGAA